MSEFDKIINTAIITLAGGIIIFSFERFISLFYLKPLQKYFELKGDICQFLIFYAAAYTTLVHMISKNKPLPEEISNASKTFRNQASSLFSIAESIYCYRLFRIIFRLPKRSKIDDAVTNLIGLSNGVMSTSENASNNNTKRAERIAKSLKFNLI